MKGIHLYILIVVLVFARGACFNSQQLVDMQLFRTSRGKPATLVMRLYPPCVDSFRCERKTSIHDGKVDSRADSRGRKSNN